jgi:hypothetical protein
MQEYVALLRVKHSVTGRFYERGEKVPVDHLEAEQLEMLIREKVLAPVVEPPPAPPEPEAPAPEPAARTRQNSKESGVKNDD